MGVVTVEESPLIPLLSVHPATSTKPLLGAEHMWLHILRLLSIQNPEPNNIFFIDYPICGIQ